jgi:hypothetical protein
MEERLMERTTLKLSEDPILGETLEGIERALGYDI